MYLIINQLQAHSLKETIFCTAIHPLERLLILIQKVQNRDIFLLIQQIF